MSKKAKKQNKAKTKKKKPSEYMENREPSVKKEEKKPVEKKVKEEKPAKAEKPKAKPKQQEKKKQPFFQKFKTDFKYFWATLPSMKVILKDTKTVLLISAGVTLVTYVLSTVFGAIATSIVWL